MEQTTLKDEATTLNDRSYGLSEEQQAKLDCNFTYHPPLCDQPRRYEMIRGMGRDLAGILSALCPQSRELSIALTKLEECIMWANAAIARNE